MRNKDKIALMPGSFDPFTVGHADIVKRALGVFDKVIIAVMINDSKSYMFSPEERCEIARRSLAGFAGVEIIFDGGMLYRLFDKVGADVIVKGIRTADDLEYENRMAEYNISHNPRAETFYIPADECLSCVSSSAFKKAVADGLLIDDYICAQARDYVKKLIDLK